MATRFGEKTKERMNGNDVAVIVTDKYKDSKAKAIDMIDNGNYGLSDGDFWILKNLTKSKEQMLYSGLIISHNGCLKINDTMSDKFRPECVSVNQNGYRDSLVFTYVCPEQGIYEVGEVNARNCSNDYPYAMAFKRLFDRVVLKLSKLAFAGIYSEEEADEFKQSKPEVTAERKATTEQVEIAAQCGVDIDRVIAYYNKLNGASITAALDLPYDILNSAIMKKRSAKVTAEAQEVFK